MWRNRGLLAHAASETEPLTGLPPKKKQNPPRHRGDDAGGQRAGHEGKSDTRRACNSADGEPMPASRRGTARECLQAPTAVGSDTLAVPDLPARSQLVDGSSL